MLLIRNEEGSISSKKFRGQRHDSLTLRNQRKHSFQVWAYDSNKYPFYNFDSIYMSWSLSDTKFGDIVYPNTDRFTQELELNDNIGSMSITAQSSSYKTGFVEGNNFDTVSDSITLNV